MSHNNEDEEEEELSPEKQRRYDELMDKTKDLMAEAVDIVSSDKEKEVFENKFKELLKDKKIPWLYTNLKTFSAGLEFGLHISQHQGMTAHTMMHLQRIIQNMEKDIKKRTPKI